MVMIVFCISLLNRLYLFQVTEDDLRSLIYCDFSEPKSDSRNYMEVRDLESLRHITEGFLEEFNNMSRKPMNLVLFR